jgi:hypothetical protein
MAKVVECLPSQLRVLSSMPSTAKKEKELERNILIAGNTIEIAVAYLRNNFVYSLHILDSACFSLE